ncbi:Cell division cycle protein 23 homolog [Anthophora retusa]
MDQFVKFDIKEVKSDLLRAINECSQRGLLHTTKWLAELSYSLKDVKLNALDITADLYLSDNEEEDTYILAKTYFDLKEYDRAAYFTEQCKTPKIL